MLDLKSEQNLDMVW